MFFDDSKQQIEKKMLLLKGVALLENSTHDALLELMLRDERMNYFEFTHYLNEILEASLVVHQETHGYVLTPLGENAIRYFSGRLDQDLLKSLTASATAINEHRSEYAAVWEALDGVPALRLTGADQGTRLLVRIEDRTLGEKLALAWERQDSIALADLLVMLVSKF